MRIGLDNGLSLNAYRWIYDKPLATLLGLGEAFVNFIYV